MDAFAFGYQVLINTYSSNWGLSGSVLWETSWIRIRIEDADPDSSGQKVAKKRADNFFYSLLNTKFNIFPAFFPLQTVFYPPGSGFGSTWRLMGSHIWMYANPHHSHFFTVIISYILYIDCHMLRWSGQFPLSWTTRRWPSTRCCSGQFYIC